MHCRLPRLPFTFTTYSSKVEAADRFLIPGSTGVQRLFSLLPVHYKRLRYVQLSRPMCFPA